MLTIGDICLSTKTGKRYVVIDHSKFDGHVKVRYAGRAHSMPARILPEADLVGVDVGRFQTATVSFNKLMERLRHGQLYR